ncbi:MAG: Na/Pi cotransporter family protein [Acidobacteriota bacterium]|nr:Na/Pi cotransporter family protein [Acidobacteriota bacterium]
MPALLIIPAMAGFNAQDMAWPKMGMELFGGLAIFLFGMEQMAEALKSVAGERMRFILGKLTANRLVGAATGAFVTAVIQSSSVTTVLAVGFISAGLMSLSQSVGVIMGANIGTTITAQIIAFKVTKLAFVMIAVGYGVGFFSKREKITQYGAVLMGLGLIFLGMNLMSMAMAPLRDYQPFLDLMTGMEHPFTGILAAAAFTGLIQSSSATTGIVIVMAGQGFISLPAGIVLAFGANIGTCVTALLAAIGKPREALRAALVHVLFNILGVVLWLGFIDQLAEFVAWFSPHYPELTGLERLAAETPRQIANAHTVFNLVNTAVLLGFSSWFVRIVEYLVPDRPLHEAEIVETRYLDDVLLGTPTLALSHVRNELGHMGHHILKMLQLIKDSLLTGDRDSLIAVADHDDKVDHLYERIIRFLGKISQRSLSREQSPELTDLMEVANYLEYIGDLMETDLVRTGLQRIEEGVTISPETTQIISDFHELVHKAVTEAVEALVEEDREQADRVIAMKEEINRVVDGAILHLAGRLVAEEPNRLKAYAIEVTAVENLKRIYYFAKKIARKVAGYE